MFLLPPFLRQFFARRARRKKQDDPRLFLSDARLVTRVKEIAVGRQRHEQDIYQELLQAGMKALDKEDEHAVVWDALSPREQQVTALICLGYRSYEIADMLGVSYETVRTHSKHIYVKFGLSRKDLRLALKDWDFKEWLGNSSI